MNLQIRRTEQEVAERIAAEDRDARRQQAFYCEFRKDVDEKRDTQKRALEPLEASYASRTAARQMRVVKDAEYDAGNPGLERKQAELCAWYNRAKQCSICQHSWSPL